SKDDRYTIYNELYIFYLKFLVPYEMKSCDLTWPITFIQFRHIIALRIHS
ncbi:hypothetical protein BDZ91DRAFT_753114, partial [Kalaharituber pfeilii]